MAKVPPNDDFLGGFAFNKAGAAPAEDDPAAGDTGPIRVPLPTSRQGAKAYIILAVILLLVAVLYVVGDYGLGGVAHQQGHGVTPEDKPAIPTKNF